MRGIDAFGWAAVLLIVALVLWEHRDNCILCGAMKDFTEKLRAERRGS